MLLLRRVFLSGIAAMSFCGQGHGAVCQAFDERAFAAIGEVASKYRLINCGAEPKDLAPLQPREKEARLVNPINNWKQNADTSDKEAVPQAVEKKPFVGAACHLLRFSRQIQFVSNAFNIDPLLLHAIAHVESRHNPQAVSPAGAIGLMQVMPATARRFGLENPEYQLFNPVENLVVSSLYLRVLYRHFGNDLPLVLAAYNAGENAVIRHGRTVPPYQETREYVRRVMNYYNQLRGS